MTTRIEELYRECHDIDGSNFDLTAYTQAVIADCVIELARDEEEIREFVAKLNEHFGSDE